MAKVKPAAAPVPTSAVDSASTVVERYEELKKRFQRMQH
jgi:hypothetical protein